MSKAVLAALSLLVSASLAGPSSLNFYVTNLVSDQPGVAQITDPSLVNAWGISASGSSPFWVSDNTGLGSAHCIGKSAARLPK